MSTLATNAITDASGGNTATINSYTPTESNMAGRNRIINGDMRIAQRGTSAVTTNGAFPVDRFLVAHGTDGAFSLQQDSSAPTGFVNSIKWTTTTADATLGATQFSMVRQKIEGTNVSDLAFGSASAKTVTLSFWVRSSLTGNFGGSITNSAQNRCYPFSYTISVADTWEQKSITISGDTTGTWLTTTGIGIDVFWGLGVGSTYSGTAGAWTSTANLYSFTGAVSVIGTLNATWQITGVQLEAGSVATPFERRLYGQELALCQRYAWRCSQYMGYASSTANVITSAVPYPVQMRAAPTLETGASFIVNFGSAGTPAIYIATGSPASPNSQYIYNTSTNWTGNASVQLNATFTAEL